MASKKTAGKKTTSKRAKKATSEKRSVTESTKTTQKAAGSRVSKKVSKKVAKKASKKVTKKASATGASVPAGATVGTLRKMHVTHSDPVSYGLVLREVTGGEKSEAGEGVVIDMNTLLGKEIQFQFLGRIECVHCGRKTNKSFNQGYCFPCLRSLAQCDACIIKPELCHYHEGTCREPEWGEKNCLQPHTVYIANTSGLKVGITRGVQGETRWMDQGAAQAVPMFTVRDRRQSGLVEVAIKQDISDRTDYRRMLKGQPDVLDMVEVVKGLRASSKDDIDAIKQEHGDDAVTEPADARVRTFNYPVTAWPQKVKPVNLDKQETVSGVLKGIKGQYLIFEDDTVFNVRRHGGYVVSFSASA